MTGTRGTRRSVRLVRVNETGADDVAELVGLLQQALDGSGPALLPVPGGTPGDAVADAAALDDLVDDDTALLLPTSGSAGEPKVVELSAGALLASARATHARIGPPGRWLLALPLTHVAGWQVLVRGLLASAADQVPAVVPLYDGFTSAALRAAIESADGDARGTGTLRYASLVPTQLGRALDDPAAAVALSRLDVVLLGGAAAPEALCRRAIEAGIRVVRTYGSTETCGGCVYDGVPLDGVEARRSDGGRLLLAGPVLATRYRGDEALTAATFVEREARRWYRTSDLAEIDDGVVTIGGRHDDVIVTGGENVAPAAVEASLATHPAVRDVVVVGVPDHEWGQVVVAVVSLRSASPTENPRDADDLARELRHHVGSALGRRAAPRRVVLVDEIPTRGIGKPDRSAAAHLATEQVGRHR